MSNLVFLVNNGDIVVPASNPSCGDYPCKDSLVPMIVAKVDKTTGKTKLKVKSMKMCPGAPQVVVQRIKGLSAVGPTISHLQGWDDTNGEFVFPVDGTYKASLTLSFAEPEDNGSQATTATVLNLAKSTNWWRQDRQLPQGFAHGYASGDVTGNPDAGEKLFVDFTNATGKEITITSVTLRVELLKEQAH